MRTIAGREPGMSTGAMHTVPWEHGIRHRPLNPCRVPGHEPDRMQLAAHPCHRSGSSRCRQVAVAAARRRKTCSKAGKGVRDLTPNAEDSPRAHAAIRRQQVEAQAGLNGIYSSRSIAAAPEPLAKHALRTRPWAWRCRYHKASSGLSWRVVAIGPTALFLHLAVFARVRSSPLLAACVCV